MLRNSTSDVAVRRAVTWQKGWLVPALLLLLIPLWPQGIATRGVRPAAPNKFSGKPWLSRFTDISAKAGFRVSTIYGGVDHIDYLVEASGGGLAAIDYDRDGWMDIFVVGGTRWTDPPSSAHHRLYHNNHDGTFTDVSKAAGVDSSGWGMGVAVGDYNGDGFDDLFVTQWGRNILYRNNGNGTFTDVTAEAGLFSNEKLWSAGATFVDYDHDGDLDLLINTYLQFDPRKTPKPGANFNCTWKGMAVACGPRGLPPGRVYLFRNDQGHFTDVSAEAGILKAQRTYAMTAVAADFDDDGWPDIYIASDSSPSLYFRNHHDGTFTEEALERGIAVNEDGREQAGMGIAVADYNGDGRLDIFKTHFADDIPVLYRNDGAGQFTDVTVGAGLAVETRYVGWGASIADFDNDGWPDIFFATGHVYPEMADYETPPVLFRNLGNGKFERIPGSLGGEALDARHSSRGSLAVDIDNDGDLDLIIWNRNEALTVLRNDTPGTNHWIEFEAPVHTRVSVTLASGRTFAQEVLSQASFYSAPGRVLHFGTGADAVVSANVRLPDGTKRTLKNLKTGQRIQLR